MKHLADRIAALPADKQGLLLQRLRQQSLLPRQPGGSPAVIAYQPQPAARMRLFCFPYAGSGASVFRQWSTFLPPDVEICGMQLPGRESRLGEPAHRRMGALLDELAVAILPLLDRPFAFFGHSMGALVAFALAQHLRRTQGIQPVQLYLAAYRAPHLPAPHLKIYHLPPEVFKVVLRADGIAESILQNDELMEAMLPTLRADLELCDTYDHTDDQPLACPLSIFGGTEDVRVRPVDLDGWSIHTTAGCRVHMLPGTHFFLHTALDQLLPVIATSLCAHISSSTPAALMNG